VDLRKGGGKWKLNHELEGEVDEMEVDQAEDRPVKKVSTLTSAMWSPCGSRIYAGTNQGEIIIFDPLTRHVSFFPPIIRISANDQVLHRLKIANATIRQIAFDSLGQ
jgi:COMPASS component SWD1